MRFGPRLAAKPEVLGVYWAYIFPLAGMASAAVRAADSEGAAGAEGFAWAWRHQSQSRAHCLMAC